MTTTQRELSSRASTPEDLLSGDQGVFELGGGHVPRINLIKPSYTTTAISDDTLFDLGILNGGQNLAHTGLALNFPYMTPQQYILQPGKEESLELEDYVQGLNDRFDLPGDQLLPMTPRCSFEQGNTATHTHSHCDAEEAYANLKRVESSLRTDNTLISNFPPNSTQSGLLPSPATSDLTTPPHGHVQDIYTHGLTTTTHLKDIAIPPPFVQKTPMGPVAYNPSMPVYVNGMYPPMTPQRHPHHVQTASMADITSSPITHPRFPTPPLSLQGEALVSPTFRHQRSMSPHDISSSPERHTSPESGSTSSYGSPQRRSIANFETPPFSPQFAPHSFGAHLMGQRRRGHARGYSTTSIMTTATYQTDASSPPSSSDEDPSYIHDGPVKNRGQRQSNIPDSTMQSYIAGPDPRDHKFECLYPDCGKRFGRKYNIQSHIQTHLSDRPYRCEVCRAGFVRQHDLRRHEKIHGGDKPFICACRKSFARQDALTRHRQR